MKKKVFRERYNGTKEVTDEKTIFITPEDLKLTTDVKLNVEEKPKKRGRKKSVK